MLVNRRHNYVNKKQALQPAFIADKVAPTNFLSDGKLACESPGKCCIVASKRTIEPLHLIIRHMDWYEEEVEQVIKKRDALSYPPKTVFYGSSSIRLWENL